MSPLRAAAVFVALSMGAGAGQQSAYRAAVDRYRASPNDGVERMLALGDADRAAGIEAAIGGHDAAAWSWDELAAAAMMHTDAAFYFLQQKQPGVPHLDAAEKLVTRAIHTDPTRSVFVRRWYVTVERIVRAYGDGAAAKGFDRHYVDRFRDRPQTVKALDAYRRGVLDELDGCEKGEFLTIRGLTESGAHLVQRYFVPAAREFQTALALEPDFAEAALHLGRIRMLEGKADAAAPLFEQAARSRARPIRYLALLFLGSMDERASRWDAAEQRYERANATFPRGQSATIALAQLLDRRARSADAARLVDRMLARRASDIVDPWWTYFDEARFDTVISMMMLRAETMK